jgi:predicted RNA-binding Zn-ribbon protein involved in translation (DUF1610 family)
MDHSCPKCGNHNIERTDSKEEGDQNRSYKCNACEYEWKYKDGRPSEVTETGE